jgi:cytochrome c peroxidase
MLRILLVATLAACSSEPASLDIPVDPTTGLRISRIPSVPALPDWPDNPPTDAKKELGRALFTDMRLSGSGHTVCGNCHLPTGSFQSGGPLDAPDRSFPNVMPTLHRHTPSLLNIVYAPMARWDGSHFTDLPDIMVLPFAEPNMNIGRLDASHGEEIALADAQVNLYHALTVDVPGYAALFDDAFGEDVTTVTPARTWRLAGEALAVYIRIAVSRDSAFDAWNAGDDGAISDAAKRGAILFSGDARCIECHVGPLLSDFKFHNVSTSVPDANGVRPDDGRFLVTGLDEDRGKFLTPGLRSAAKTSPYLHDGSQVSISKVIAHFTGDSGHSDPLNELAGLPSLTDDQIDDLVQFIKSLDGAPIPVEELAPPVRLPSP